MSSRQGQFASWMEISAGWQQDQALLCRSMALFHGNAHPNLKICPKTGFLMNRKGKMGMKQKLRFLSIRGRALVLLSFLLATLLAGMTVVLSQHRSTQAASIVSVGSGSYTTAAPSDLTLPPNTIYRTAKV